MTAKETAKLLRRLGACPEARKWSAGHTLEWAWANAGPEWLGWLADALGVQMTAPARAEYGRVTAEAYRVATPYSQIAKAALRA